MNEVVGADALRLSIVTVNYNGGPLLRRSLDRLRVEGRPDWEVFLVDNASRDGSLNGLEAAWPELRVIRNQENVGYAAANNQALRLARGQYLLLLNPDVLVEPGAISTALAYLDAHPEVGILGPRILLPSGRLDPPARRTFKTPATYLYKLTGLAWLFPRHRRFGRYYLSFLDESQLTQVDAVVGAFLLIRRTVVEQVGLLDEQFFMYCEDEDWCWRAKQAGWQVIYHPAVVVHHYKGSSAGRRPFRMICQWHRSIFLYHRKNIAPRYSVAVNGAVYFGMLLSLTATLSLTAARQMAAAWSTRRAARRQALKPDSGNRPL